MVTLRPEVETVTWRLKVALTRRLDVETGTLKPAVTLTRRLEVLAGTLRPEALTLEFVENKLDSGRSPHRKRIQYTLSGSICYMSNT